MSVWGIMMMLSIGIVATILWFNGNLLDPIFWFAELFLWPFIGFSCNLIWRLRKFNFF